MMKQEYTQDHVAYPHIYLVQMARATRAVERYRTAICTQDHPQWHVYYELDDHLHSMFQSLWHIKDWLRHDPTVKDSVRKAAAVKAAERHRDLKVACDLANGSKHLIKSSDRTGAQDDALQFPPCGQGRVGMLHIIKLRDNTSATAIEFGERALQAWRTILSEHGFPWISKFVPT